MKMINEQEVFEDWFPLIESKTNISDPYKKEWLAKYSHYHALNESSVHSGFNTLDAMNGQGMPQAPQRGANGSGDKFPSLLPLAIQVAAKTVGFDIVPVIPMPGPTGVLTYLDYVYAGGRLDSGTHRPLVIKAPYTGTWTAGTAYAATNSNDTLALVFVGYSRIDAYPIFRVTGGSGDAVTVATIFGVTGSTVASDAGTVAIATTPAELVAALEDHVAGFTGAGNTDTDAWGGPFAETPEKNGPMTREVGESTYYRSMGLKTFTKFVEAKTYQASAAVTTEQIQDLNRQFGIDVVSMVENALINEVSQSINKDILGNGFRLGAKNAADFAIAEGQSLNLDLTSLPTVGTNENLQTFQRRIFSKILAAGNVVSNRGRRGPANFVVTNAQIATAIQDISQFTTAPFANTATQNNGSLYPVGTLAGMTVYVDQNMRWNDTKVLVGRKGADDEPGLKFMPYMMAESIQTIAEGTMSPKIAVKSRYALIEAGFHPQTMYFTFTVTVPTAGIV